MKNISWVLALCSCLIIFGCTNSYTVTEFKSPHEPPPTYSDYILKRPFGEVTITGASKSIFKLIKRDFMNARIEAQFSVASIRISSDPEDKEFQNGKGGSAHFHLSSPLLRIEFNGYMPQLLMPGGKICINPIYFNGVLRHEMSHAQVFFWGISLEKIAKISEWKYNYFLWRWEDQENYPKDGFLRPYSTKSPSEETADIVGAVSNFYFDLEDPYTGLPHAFFRIDKKDGRYLKKIEAVYELGLTTKKEHKKIIEYFNKK